jgi:hypothetical protein
MHARSLVLVLAVLGLLTAAGCGSSSDTTSTAKPGSDAYVIASYRGTLHQQGRPDFRITADVRSLSDAKQNTVSYTGIDCSGHWTYLGYRQGVYRFREVIDTGHGGKCKGVGHVTLTPKGESQVGYVFRGGGVVSRGTLARTA